MIQDDELLHKWVNNSLTPEELERFKARPDYYSLEKLRRETDKMILPPFDEEAVLHAILETKKPPFSEEESRRAIRTLYRMASYAAAAAVLIAVVWLLWPSSSSSTEVVMKLANAEKIEGYLPDGSSFVLNAGSTLSYDEEAWATKRLLRLEGEGFFNVTKGATFEVNTINGTIQVLGTQFNVWSRDGLLEVKCMEGKVAIHAPGGTLLNELELNEALRVEAGKVVEQWRFDGQAETNWMSGITSLKNVPLQVALEELERQFDVEIHSERVNQEERISCNFQHQDLELALTTVLEPLGIAFEIRKNGEVYLSQ